MYQGLDEHVHELRLETQGWIHADLSAIVMNSPPAFPGFIGIPFLVTGRPSAQVTADGVPRVVYRGQDNHVHELRLESQGWFQADLSTLAGSDAPASGDPFAYATPDGVPRVVYTGQDNHVHELRLEVQGWFQADLTSLGHAPLAGGDPFAYVTPDGVPRVIHVS